MPSDELSPRKKAIQDFDALIEQLEPLIQESGSLRKVVVASLAEGVKSAAQLLARSAKGEPVFAEKIQLDAAKALIKLAPLVLQNLPHRGDGSSDPSAANN